MRRPSRPTAFAASLAMAFWLLTAPTAAAAERAGPPQDVAMNCNLVAGGLYWFCQSLESRNCNLAERERYWLCKALVENNCSLAESADYWWCQARVQRDCNLAERADYWSCKGVVEHCDLAPREEVAFCNAVGAFFRTSRIP